MNINIFTNLPQSKKLRIVCLVGVVVGWVGNPPEMDGLNFVILKKRNWNLYLWNIFFILLPHRNPNRLLSAYSSKKQGQQSDGDKTEVNTGGSSKYTIPATILHSNVSYIFIVNPFKGLTSSCTKSDLYHIPFFLLSFLSQTRLK